MDNVRERLANLASSLGIDLPESYLYFMESRPKHGILLRHRCSPEDLSYEWWPASVEFLEQDIHQGRWHKIEQYAHYMQSTAEQFLAGGHSSVTGPGGSRFGTERMSHGFWIGEVDGDSVFIDQETCGVFAWLEHEGKVEQWAASFADLVAHGQQSGKDVELPDPSKGKDD